MKIIKPTKPVLLGVALFLTVFSPQLQADWSANVGATTDYLFRGLTKTNGRAAISGGIRYEHESGFYVTGLVSSVDFRDDAGLSAPSIEADIALGYANTAGDSFGYDVSLVHYWYPYANTVGLDYGELVLNFSSDDFIFGLAYTVETQNKAITSNEVGDLYFYLGYSDEYDDGWSFSFIFGSQTFKSSDEERSLRLLQQVLGINPRANFTDHFYIEFVLGKRTDFGDFSLSLTQIVNIDLFLEIIPETSIDRRLRPSVSWVLHF